MPPRKSWQDPERGRQNRREFINAHPTMRSTLPIGGSRQYRLGDYSQTGIGRDLSVDRTVTETSKYISGPGGRFTRVLSGGGWDFLINQRALNELLDNKPSSRVGRWLLDFGNEVKVIAETMTSSMEPVPKPRLAQRTGRLHRSHRVNVDQGKDTLGRFTQSVLQVENTAPYAWFQHEGYAKGGPRPWLRYSLQYVAGKRLQEQGLESRDAQKDAKRFAESGTSLSGAAFRQQVDSGGQKPTGRRQSFED